MKNVTPATLVVSILITAILGFFGGLAFNTQELQRQHESVKELEVEVNNFLLKARQATIATDREWEQRQLTQYERDVIEGRRAGTVIMSPGLHMHRLRPNGPALYEAID